MNINRNNYEEFFLLYTDGELSATEQEAVRRFAALHPDLEEELQLLLDLRMEPDAHIKFPKERLLKPLLWDVEAPTDMQEQMLAMLDGELNEKEQTELLAAIAADPQLQLEWDTLQRFGQLPEEAMETSFPKERLLRTLNEEEPDAVQEALFRMLDGEMGIEEQGIWQARIANDPLVSAEWERIQLAKLPAETVVFPDKASLYREEKARRIVPIFRWAAAAAVILGAGWFLLQQQDTPTVQPQFAINGTNDPKPKQTKDATTGVTTLDGGNNGTVVGTKDDDLTTRATGTTADARVNETKRNSAAQQDIQKKAGDEMTSSTLIAANDVDHDADANSADAPFERMIVDRSAITADTDAAEERQMPGQLTSAELRPDGPMNMMVRTASYKEVEDNTGDDDEVVYIAGAKLNKHKVRGIFRGITRTLGRTFSSSKVEQAKPVDNVTRSLLP